jgi:ATP adenylyltransferase
MIAEQRKAILEADSSVLGFNVGINLSAVAGQTIFHAHIHLIPRREGDVIDPRGGTRGIIPSKQLYQVSMRWA